MRTVLQAAIIGLSAGSVYALMASGLTLVFGVMRVVNVAQGALVILGAYLSYSLFSRFHLDPFLAILLVAPMLFALGVGLQLAFVRRLRRDEQELSLLVMFAVAVGIEGALTLVYKTTYRSINPGYANRVLELAGFKVPLVRVLAFALSVVVLSALWVVLQRTRFGRALRATVQNPTAARLLGVEAERVAALGFGLGASTGAAAGAVYGIVFPFNPGSHYDLISRLLSIVVLGGLGSLGGSVVAALLMGVAEAVVAATLSPVWSSFAFFAVLLGVLLVRPQGMFGTVQRGGL
jgi:branched-chain amino acid transport system permease protein